MAAKPTYKELEQKIREFEQGAGKHAETGGPIDLQTQILSSIKDTIVIITPEMKTIYANQTAKDLFGDRPEMFTEPCYRFFKNRDTVCENCPVLKTIEDAKPHKAVMQSYDKDGKEMWRFNTAFPFFDRDGQVIAGIEMVTDFTPQKRTETALQESEERYRAIFDHVSDAVAIYEVRNEGEDFIFVDFNKTGERIEDIHKETLIGRSVLEVFPGVKEFGLFDVFKRVWKTGKPENHPIAMYKDERIEGWRDNFVCKLPSGEIVAVYSDETERRQTAENLEKSEEKYRNIFNNAQVGIFRTRLSDGKVLECNDRFARTYGYKNPEECKNDFVVSEHYSDHGDREKMMESLLEKGEVSNLEARFHRKDGDEVWVRFSAHAYPEEGYLEGVGFDITDRKLAEETLRESEEKYRTILESIEDAYFEVDIHGNLTFFNDSLCKALGYSRDELTGMNNRQYTDEENVKKVYQIFNRVYTTGRPDKGFDWELTRKDGSRIYVEASVSLRKDSEGQPIGFRGIARDISERRQAEQDKARLEAQLQQAQKMEAIGTLAGGIAHDFNNLLMAIQGRTSIMRMSKDSSHPDFEHLKGVEDHVKSAADLTRQLLGFARGGKYEVRPVDLNELIEKQNRMFGRTKKEIVINGKYEENLWSVEIDRGQIEQVLLNLFVNAWQAMPGGGDLYLSTENVTLDKSYVKPFSIEHGRYVKISVTDTGTGMDKATQKKIFDPFFTTKEMGRGTGLGLASSYGIIKNHGGFINVYSEKGHGTTFNIYLPASESLVIEDKKPSGDLLKGSETVLFIDDEDIIIEVAEEMLKELGYKVLIARGGKEAIEIYEKNKGRLIW